MLPPLSLRSKIMCGVTAMAAIVLGGGLVMLWYTYRIDTTFGDVVKKELVLYEAAQEMELALANQKGFLTYYLVDGDARWLKSLGQYRQVFQQCLDRARDLDLDGEQQEALARIAGEYAAYIEAKDIAIENYRGATATTSISALHEKQRSAFFGLLERCRSFSQKQWQVIQGMERANQQRSQRLRALAYGAILAFVAVCSLLLFFLYRRIFVPLRRLAIETGGSERNSTRDEVESLSHSLKDMRRDIDETYGELEKSRNHLVQVERLAMVGELAAGVAHTIRNPFTSIKMRMFSLTRSLELSEVQHEDLTVISDEIGRIDNIVQNFLEFARPPKLNFQPCCLGTLINSVITLLEYRLKEYGAEIVFQYRPGLPAAIVDADRIREALVNLITNACESMKTGGRVYLSDTREHDPDMGDIAVVTVEDDGPGIDEAIVEKITTPFFTTKETGSGLGLSIVARIVREHHGRLMITPSQGARGRGAAFTIKLPLKRGAHEPDPYHR